MAKAEDVSLNRTPYPLLNTLKSGHLTHQDTFFCPQSVLIWEIPLQCCTCTSVRHLSRHSGGIRCIRPGLFIPIPPVLMPQALPVTCTLLCGTRQYRTAIFSGFHSCQMCGTEMGFYFQFAIQCTRNSVSWYQQKCLICREFMDIYITISTYITVSGKWVLWTHAHSREGGRTVIAACVQC